jgi:hypothetical protein
MKDRLNSSREKELDLGLHEMMAIARDRLKKVSFASSKL